jgi:hypothetical protein
MHPVRAVALSEHGGKVLTIRTELNAGNCVFRISTDRKPVSHDGNTKTRSAVEAEGGLALSACQAILKEHRGQVLS